AVLRLLCCSRPLSHPHSFPTRRSSDLASLNRRFSSGLQTQLSYTFSKSIDNNSGVYPFDGANSVTLDSFNSSAERGLSNFSRKRSEEHTSELQSRFDLVCRLLLEKKKH